MQNRPSPNQVNSRTIGNYSFLHIQISKSWIMIRDKHTLSKSVISKLVLLIILISSSNLNSQTAKEEQLLIADSILSQLVNSDGSDNDWESILADSAFNIYRSTENYCNQAYSRILQSSRLKQSCRTAPSSLDNLVAAIQFGRPAIPH